MYNVFDIPKRYLAKALLRSFVLRLYCFGISPQVLRVLIWLYYIDVCDVI